MALVRVEKIQQGMVLSEDVWDMNERLLLSKGVEMGNQHIRILKMWGVVEVQVDTDDDSERQDEVSFDSDQARKMAHALSRCFAKVDISHPVIKEILRLLGQ